MRDLRLTWKNNPSVRLLRKDIGKQNPNVEIIQPTYNNTKI